MEEGKEGGRAGDRRAGGAGGNNSRGLKTRVGEGGGLEQVVGGHMGETRTQGVGYVWVQRCTGYTKTSCAASQKHGPT